ncbi:MAG: Coenzyme F420 hydrogenase/dehydrogenase, beta subunit C-terminal domain, partial [Clostridia bacterium]|nr:Coenzyme F420 hydrogenase/dehydrogenase, beta subunit C-terminal domain [Clostridia bacterium]
MQIVDKSLCSGCSACLHICPKNSISMEPDKNGFLRPVIDETKCTNCGLCKKTCPVLNKKEQQEKNVQAYAVINKDEGVRKDSSSGGVFTQIAKYVLSKNGVVFGALFDENFKVKHAYIESENDLIKLQKSKYVQSEIGVTYKEAKNFLDQGRFVLFTGTPCQIGGLQAYLKKPYDNLITQDFICHGVPSPKVWKKYIDKKKKVGNIKEVSFKDKRTGWNKYSIT